MSRKNHFSARQEIQDWSEDDVQEVLKKNGLEDCCVAFKKRVIDGSGLLALTEGKLALWKRDLTPTNIRKLSKFVQELTLQPEKYVFQKNEPNGNPTSAITANNVSTYNKRTNFVPRKLSTTLVPPHEVDDTFGSALTNIKSNCSDSSSGYIDTSSWDTDFYEEKSSQRHMNKTKKM